jgi:thiamine biosynthesis lipoprotein ApbE
VTFAALSGLWKFDHDIDGQVPDRSQNRATAAASSTIARCRSRSRRHGVTDACRMKGDLGGIGKGYACRSRGDDPARCRVIRIS